MRKVFGLIFAALAVSCQQPQSFEKTGFMLGTYIKIKVWGKSMQELEAAVDSAFIELERVEKLTSHFLAESKVSAFNTSSQVVSEELSTLVSHAIDISELTEGSFDPTIYPLLDLWGFYDSSEYNIPSDEKIRDALKEVNWQGIEIVEDTLRVNGVKLDLAGIAKGYAVDRAVLRLAELGVKQALVDAGGDIYCLGEKKGNWSIGIRHPRNQDLMGVILIEQGAVATSGDYENFFEKDGTRYHHLMDPATGKPTKGIMSATVIAPTTMEADAWATALVIMGKKGIDLLDSIDNVEGLIVTENLDIITTNKFPTLEE